MVWIRGVGCRQRGANIVMVKHLDEEALDEKALDEEALDEEALQHSLIRLACN